jgi:hypothetical protein
MLRIAIYARVSTSDKGQDTENQLRELRQFVANKATEGWTLAGEYVDHATGKHANRLESHPRWYGVQRDRTNSERRNPGVLMPPTSPAWGFRHPPCHSRGRLADPKDVPDAQR